MVQDLSRTGAVERDVEQVLFSHLQSFCNVFYVVICAIRVSGKCLYFMLNL